MNIKTFSFRKGDIFAIGTVAACALLLLLFFPQSFFSSGSGTVQIYLGQRLIKELPLNAEESFAVRGKYTNVVTVKNGCVSVAESDCPGKDCVHSGAIRSDSNVIVCLPNRMTVRITAESEIDMTAG